MAYVIKKTGHFDSVIGKDEEAKKGLERALGKQFQSLDEVGLAINAHPPGNRYSDFYVDREREGWIESLPDTINEVPIYYTDKLGQSLPIAKVRAIEE